MSLLRSRNVLDRHPKTSVVGQWLLQGLFQKLLHLTCECCHWYCSCGYCSVASNVRGAEHGIYLDGNSFASSLTIFISYAYLYNVLHFIVNKIYSVNQYMTIA